MVREAFEGVFGGSGGSISHGSQSREIFELFGGDPADVQEHSNLDSSMDGDNESGGDSGDVQERSNLNPSMDEDIESGGMGNVAHMDEGGQSGGGVQYDAHVSGDKEMIANSVPDFPYDAHISGDSEMMDRQRRRAPYDAHFGG